MYFAGMDAFLAIINTGSLKRAAEVLNLTQATVSYRLKMLEQEAGGRLIERGKGVRSIVLTPFGESFVGIAERWSSLMLEMEELQSTGPQISLSIGGSNSINTYILPPLYRQLIQHQPRLKLQFRTQHSDELYDAMERREIDVAFAKFEKKLPNILVEPFYVDEMVLIRSASPDKSEMPPVHPQYLPGEHEIFMNWSPAFKEWHDSWWDPICPLRIKVDTAGLINTVMTSPESWSIVPLSVAREFVKSGRFVMQKLLATPPVRTCYIITRTNSSPVVNRGIEILNRHLAMHFPMPEIS